MPKAKRSMRRTVRKINYVRLAVVVAVFAFLICTGSVLGLIAYSLKDMPAWDPTALELNLPSLIYDKDGNEATRIYVENRQPVRFDEVPEIVTGAFLAIEDVRFWDHKGLDLKRIIGALLADIKAGKAAQGASTITQQLVKRAFLSPEKTLSRKIQEAYLAVQLERKFTKEEIFEMYLNQIYFGEGAYGIESAAQVYFGKPMKKLELHEAALLAGLPKAPNTYNPFKNPDAARKRRNVVLEAMAKNEFITREQSESAKAKDITLTGAGARENQTYKFPYFVDHVTDILLAKYGEDKVYKGGLQVYTTLDPKIQTYAEEALANPKNFPKSSEDENGVIQPQAAAVVLDPHTGHIKAIVGGRDHKQKRQFNRATDAMRQPGSAFKPIIAYGPAIEKGKAPATVVDDSPTKFGSREFKNYDGKFHGLVTYRTALLNSYNIPAVKVLQETGVSKALSFARKLGITTLVSSSDNPKRNDENLSSALGGLTKGVIPLELAGAYGSFANEGVYVEPIAILEVRDRNGNIIDRFKPKKTIAMKKTTAYLMTSMLQSGVTSGTGKNASLGSRPVAGKTGTTSDYKDAWFAGYTPELVTVVWIGHDDPKPMYKVTGGSYPARIWRQIMSKALKDAPVKDFVQPEGIVSATVCSKSGNTPSDICPQEDLVTDIFAKGTVPSDVCDIHVLVEVCTESNQLPTVNCPEKTTRAFVKGREPTEPCTVHSGPRAFGIPICTDPRHGGIQHLANIASNNEEGGCPKESVRYIDFPEGQEPTAYCTIPEHQTRPKKPDNPENPALPGIDKPKVDKPEKPKREQSG